MPVKGLLNAIDPAPPAAVREVGDQLIYRDFLTVGLLCQKLKVRDDRAQSDSLIKDNWIYIQEPDVEVGRLQIFNNWSPYMVSDKSKVWLGLEYFCFDGDELWQMTDDALARLGTKELAMIDIIDESQVLDGTVLRMDKTYPAFFGSYDERTTARPCGPRSGATRAKRYSCHASRTPPYPPFFAKPTQFGTQEAKKSWRLSG